MASADGRDHVFTNPPRKTEYSDGMREAIMRLRENGKSFGGIAGILGMPKSSVTRVVKSCLANGTTEKKKRPGRPPKFSQRTRNRLIMYCKAHRFASVQDLQTMLNDERPQKVSLKTVRRMLRSEGMLHRVPKKSMIIAERNRMKRVKFARVHRSWTLQNWYRVIFSDESFFVIGRKGKVYCWRRADEGLRPHLIPPVKDRAITLMVWGCISSKGPGTLCQVNGTITSIKYCQILDEQLWPVLAKDFPTGNYVFMQDNAPVHKSNHSMEWLRSREVNVMDWPAQSPDMNPIENVWGIMKREIARNISQIKCKADLWRACQNVWAQLTPVDINQLYQTLPNRCSEVRKMKGFITKY